MQASHLYTSASQPITSFLVACMVARFHGPLINRLSFNLTDLSSLGFFGARPEVSLRAISHFSPRRAGRHPGRGSGKPAAARITSKLDRASFAMAQLLLVAAAPEVRRLANRPHPSRCLDKPTSATSPDWQVRATPSIIELIRARHIGSRPSEHLVGSS